MIIASDLGFPIGLTLDMDSHRIFWVDSQLHRIESADLDGKYRNILIKDIAQPFGLTLIDQHIFWSDTQNKAVERANKVTGADHETICDNIDNITEIKAAAHSRQVGTNPCALLNGACSHLCLFRPQGISKYKLAN